MRTRWPSILLVIVLAVLVWSMVDSYGWANWLLEAAPVLIAVPLLIATRGRFPLSGLSYTLIAIHAVILLVGAHYTYARVPLFDWIRELFELERNHYDRLGHFAQGFVPAILSREILLRTSPLHRGGWLRFLVVCVSLAISASYELIEWLSVALSQSSVTEDFLGMQGDVWDAQKDMALALAGAVLALATLSRMHDRSMARLENEKNMRSD